MNTKKVDAILKNIYYNLKSPHAYTSQVRVYAAAKKLHPNLKKLDVKKWFQKELAPTLHKPVTHNFLRNRTVVMNIADQYQADLCDMTSLRKYNDDYTFLLTCVDCFSRRAWVKPLKNKQGKNVALALEEIFRDQPPKRLQTDKGTEFYNSHVAAVLAAHGVERWGSENDDVKAALVERFNRTLKTRMYKFFTGSRTRRYIDALPDLVTGYNRSRHRSIKMAPSDVRKKDQVKIRQLLYKKQKLATKKYKYNVNDLVRISKASRVFKKGYLPNWSDELFKIVLRKRRARNVYSLESETDGEEIRGTFYEEELQLVQRPDAYRVERVVRTRTRAGKKEYLVRWLGFDSAHDQWVKEKDLLI